MHYIKRRAYTDAMNLATYFEMQGHGSKTKLAKTINAFSSDVSDWTHGYRRVPVERCPAIEAATDGLVRCEDLRPDVAWGVLRGTGITLNVDLHQPAGQGVRA